MDKSLQFVLSTIVLLTIYPKQGSGVYEKVASHAGRVFLIVPGPGKPQAARRWQGHRGAGRVSIINHNERGTKVRVSCPRSKYFGSMQCPIAWSQNVLTLKIWSFNLATTLRVQSSGTTDLVTMIEASNKIVVFVYSSYSRAEGEMFMAFPLHAARSLYYFPVQNDGFFVVIATEKNTEFVTSYSLPPYSTNNFRYVMNGQTCNTSPDIAFRVKLDKYEVFVAIHSGFAGKSLISSKPVLVTTGAVTTMIRGKGRYIRYLKSNHMEESLMPVSAWGRKYVVVALPIRNSHPGYVCIMAFEGNTHVTIKNGKTVLNLILKHEGNLRKYAMDGRMSLYISADRPLYVTQFGESGSMSETSSPTLLNVIPVENYLLFYIVKFMKDAHGRFYRQYYLTVVIEATKLGGLCFDYRCGMKLDRAKDIEGYAIGSATLQWSSYTESHVVRHWDGNVTFGLYVFGTSGDTVAATTAGMGLPQSLTGEDGLCRMTSARPDDGLDNDCDGEVDEEEFDLLDNDGDGMADEDMISTGSRHGHWGEWGEWICPARCGDKEPSWRIRQCDNPTKLGTGKVCPGSPVDVGDLCPNHTVSCFVDCPPNLWGADCENNCSTQCRDQLCHSFDGTCDNCGVGVHGAFCHIECPRYHYGNFCNSTCFDCFADCNYITGECIRDINVYIVMAIMIVLALLPTGATLLNYCVPFYCPHGKRDGSDASDFQTMRKKKNRLHQMLQFVPRRFRHHFDITSSESSDTSSDDDDDDDDDSRTNSEDEDDDYRRFKILMRLYGDVSDVGTEV